MSTLSAQLNTDQFVYMRKPPEVRKESPRQLEIPVASEHPGVRAVPVPIRQIYPQDLQDIEYSTQKDPFAGVGNN